MQFPPGAYTDPNADTSKDFMASPKRPLFDLSFESTDIKEDRAIRLRSTVLVFLGTVFVDCIIPSWKWTRLMVILVFQTQRAVQLYRVTASQSASRRGSSPLVALFFASLVLYIYAAPVWHSGVIYEGVYGFLWSVLILGVWNAVSNDEPPPATERDFVFRLEVLAWYVVFSMPWLLCDTLRAAITPLSRCAIAPSGVFLYTLAFLDPLGSPHPFLTRWESVGIGKGFDALCDLKDVCFSWSVYSVPRILQRRLSSWQRRKVAIRESQNGYDYKPLADDQIRILVLEKCSKWAPGMIRASTLSVNINFAPRYFAVSYRWDNPQRSEEMLLDGRRFAVTKSALDVLLACRSSVKDVFVWIDAICINQSDEMEKGFQVQMMTQIYEHAATVLLFPGFDWRRRLAATTILYHVKKPAPLHGVNALEAWVFHCEDVLRQYWTNSLPDAEPLEDIRKSLRPGFRALMELVNDDYWTRVWVIQEVSVGMHVDLYLGGIIIPWDTFATVMSRLLNPGNRLLMTLLHYSDGKLFWDADTTQSFVAFTVHNSLKLHCDHIKTEDEFQDISESMRVNRRAFESLLFDTCRFGATDARDKIFAIMGMALDLVPGAACLRVDYAEPLTGILEDATRYLLFHQKVPSSHALALSGIGHSPSKSTDRPSWVLHVDKLITPRPLSMAPYMPQSVYHAGCHSTIHTTVACGHLPSSIALNGVPSDTMVCLSPHGPLEYSADAFSYIDPVAMVRAKLAFALVAVSMVEDILALWRIPIPREQIFHELGIAFSGDYILYYEPQELYRTVFRDWLRFMFPATEASSFREMPAKLLQNLLQDPHSGGGRDWNLGTVLIFDAHVVATCLGRQFGIAEKGRVCFVPPFARVGDAVFVAYGAQVPFAIRKKGAREADGVYELVGEAYVQGIMRGEALDESEGEVGATVVTLV